MCAHPSLGKTKSGNSFYLPIAINTAEFISFMPLTMRKRMTHFNTFAFSTNLLSKMAAGQLMESFQWQVRLAEACCSRSGSTRERHAETSGGGLIIYYLVLILRGFLLTINHR
jgi:hypothetical protein